MRLDADQLEWVIREVVRRLQTAGVAKGHSTAPARGANSCAGNTPHELALAERVITTRDLDGKLAGVNCLRIARRAIVTPAVRDLLQEKGIQLHRSET